MPSPGLVGVDRGRSSCFHEVKILLGERHTHSSLSTGRL
jgi:hypothetical protein